MHRLLMKISTVHELCISRLLSPQMSKGTSFLSIEEFMAESTLALTLRKEEILT